MDWKKLVSNVTFALSFCGFIALVVGFIDLTLYAFGVGNSLLFTMPQFILIGIWAAIFGIIFSNTYDEPNVRQ